MSNTFKAAASNNSSPHCSPFRKWVYPNIVERTKVTFWKNVHKPDIEAYFGTMDYSIGAAITLACCLAEGFEFRDEPALQGPGKTIMYDALTSFSGICDNILECCDQNEFDYYRVVKNLCVLTPVDFKIVSAKRASDELVEFAIKNNAAVIMFLNMPSPIDDPVFGQVCEPLCRTLARIASDSDVATVAHFHDYDGEFDATHEFDDGNELESMLRQLHKH